MFSMVWGRCGVTAKCRSLGVGVQLLKQSKSCFSSFHIDALQANEGYFSKHVPIFLRCSSYIHLTCEMCAVC